MSAPADPFAPYRDPRAHALRDRYTAHFGPITLPVPVQAIAEDLLGLYVETADLDVSGMLVPAERRIWLNGPEYEPRRRFTLAHELGHWVCQCDGGTTIEPIYCRTQDLDEQHAETQRRLEREANIFAAELLMPEPLVRAEHERAASIEELADRFGVSRPAMHWRLYSFGLVDTRPQPARPGDPT